MLNFSRRRTDTIGQRIKLALALRNRTTADVEREYGISRSYISRAINGSIEKPYKLIRTLSNYLNISEVWLKTGEGIIEKNSEKLFRIYDVKNKSYINSSVYINNENKDNNIKAFTNIDNGFHGSDCIFIVRKLDQYHNGLYAFEYNSFFYILMRRNTEKGALWFDENNNEVNVNLLGFNLVGSIEMILTTGKKEIEII